MFGRLLFISLAVMSAGSSASFSLTFSVLHSAHAVSLPVDQAAQWLKELEVLIGKQEWKSAEELARKVLEATKGEETPRRMNGLTSFGKVMVALNGQERIDAAIQAFTESLSISQKLFLGDHANTVQCFSNLATCLDTAHRSREALPFHENALEMSRRLHLGDHPIVASMLGNIAVCYEQLEQYDNALRSYEEALLISRRVFPNDHQELAISIQNIAGFLVFLGKASDGLPLLKESLEMLIRLHGSDHPDVAWSMNSYASCLNALGRTQEALEKYSQSVSVYRRVLPDNHPDLALSLNNLGYTLKEMDLPSDSLPYLQESLQMFQILFGTVHPDVAMVKNNIASSLDRLGRPNEALIMYQESLDIYRNLDNSNQIDIAIVLNNQASCFQDIGEPEKAIDMYKEALQIYQTWFGSENHYMAITLGNLASCLHQVGRNEDAIKVSKDSLEMTKRIFEEGHLDAAIAQNKHAIHLVEAGREAEAMVLFKSSLSIFKSLCRSGQPTLLISLFNVSSCLDSLGRSSESLPLRREWLRGVSSFVQRSSLAWEGGVDRRAEGYASQISSLPQGVFESEQGLVCEARFYLREAASLSRALSSLPEDKALQGLRHAMLESKVAAERAALGGGDAAQALQKADADYVRYSQALEARHGDRLRLKAPSLEDLQGVLGSDSLAADIHRRTDRKDPYYVAVVLGAGAPQFVELGSEAAIQSELRRLSGSFSRSGQGLGAEASLTALDRLTLRRLDPYLKGRTKLYLAVDGVLAQVPFPALISGTSPDAKKPGGVRNRHRVEDLQISLLPSVLNLAAKSFGSGAKGSVLVGGVDYESAEGRSSPSGFKPLPAIPSGTRGLPSNGRWGPLSASSSEMASLKSLPMFSQALELSGSGATEPALMSKVQSPRYLHFSTHAFFVPRKEGAGKGARLDQISSSDDPMHRSALVLAGANAQGALPQEDGYLLASEASRLKLSGTRLVTLGACESGLGDNSVGQGILGLRRAFRAAGAQGVVMSLYVVPDSGTAELMKRLYGSLGSGMTAPAALRQAQLSMLLEGQGVFSWGLFVYEGSEK